MKYCCCLSGYAIAKSEVTADASCRLSKLAGEELSSLQASNFSSTGDISAHASGVRTLVLRVLKAAISLTKAKPNKQKDQVRATLQHDMCYYWGLPASHVAVGRKLPSAIFVVSHHEDLPNVHWCLYKVQAFNTRSLLNGAMAHASPPAWTLHSSCT